MWKNNPSLNLPPIRDSQSAPNILQHNKSRWFSTTYNTVFNARPLGRYAHSVCTVQKIREIYVYSGRAAPYPEPSLPLTSDREASDPGEFLESLPNLCSIELSPWPTVFRSFLQFLRSMKSILQRNSREKLVSSSLRRA